MISQGQGHQGLSREGLTHPIKSTIVITTLCTGKPSGPGFPPNQSDSPIQYTTPSAGTVMQACHREKKTNQALVNTRW